MLTASVDRREEIESIPSVAYVTEPIDLAESGGRCRKAMPGLWAKRTPAIRAAHGQTPTLGVVLITSSSCCSDRYIISVFPHLHILIYSSLPPPPPFSPSLISLMVSVDVKHHVYLITCWICSEPVWSSGKAGKAGKRDLGSIPLWRSFLFKSCGLWTLSCDFVPHNYETLKWLSSLSILMQESFWWRQCSDRYIVSLF